MDITKLPKSGKDEIAQYIKRDNLKIANEKLQCYQPKCSFYTKIGKRFFDIIVSLIALIVTIPINLIIALITFFDVGSPIIFKQIRLGKDGKRFTIYKFRNMTNAKDTNGELLPPEERVTKWGTFVRKTSLDELLNFVSIFKGDMSIIGPRPLLDTYEDRMTDRHKVMYKVKPGLECPPINKLNRELSWEDRFENYAWYAANCSFKTDLALMFRVVEMAFDHKSTERRSTAQDGAFLGYNEDGHVIYSKNVPDKYVSEYCRNHGYESLKEAVEDRMNINA